METNETRVSSRCASALQNVVFFAARAIYIYFPRCSLISLVAVCRLLAARVRCTECGCLGATPSFPGSALCGPHGPILAAFLLGAHDFGYLPLHRVPDLNESTRLWPQQTTKT